MRADNMSTWLDHLTKIFRLDRLACLMLLIEQQNITSKNQLLVLVFISQFIFSMDPFQCATFDPCTIVELPLPF